MELKQGYDLLKSNWRYDNKIRRIKYTIAELRACELPRSGGDGTCVQTSKNSSQIERITLRIVELETELEDLLAQKANAIMKIDAALDRLPEGAEKTILYDFYIGRIPMIKIANSIGYNVKHCYKLRKKGIEML